MTPELKQKIRRFKRIYPYPAWDDLTTFNKILVRADVGFWKATKYLTPHSIGASNHDPMMPHCQSSNNAFAGRTIGCNKNAQFRYVAHLPGGVDSVDLCFDCIEASTKEWLNNQLRLLDKEIRIISEKDGPVGGRIENRILCPKCGNLF